MMIVGATKIVFTNKNALNCHNKVWLTSKKKINTNSDLRKDIKFETNEKAKMTSKMILLNMFYRN